MDNNHLKNRLDKMFFPQSIALIGASDVPGKWGNLILMSVLGGGYTGKIYPVNPKKDSILDIKTYPILSDIPDDIDLAIITIPARLVPDALKNCISKGIDSVVVISSGFKETGSEGAELEKEICRIAREGDLLFIGPNTMGIASAHHHFEAVPTPTAARPGGLAIISQSGNLGLQIMKWTAHKDIGLSIYAGTGNEALLKASDLVTYLGKLDEVKAIAMYIEGITNGREFREHAKIITKKKPIIALKTGRSKSGSKAAQSHTGSMAGSFATYSAMFRQTGIIQVRTPSELLNVAAAMTHLPVPKSNRVGIMTMGGGWGVITADECEDSNLELPALSQEIIKDLDNLLPDYWNRSNPIDVVGEGDPDLYLHVIEALAKWDEIDSVIALGIVGRSMFIEDMIECQEKIDGKIFSRELKLSILKDQIKTEQRIISGIGRIQKETGKPIPVVALTEGGLILTDTEYGGVISLSTPEEAVNILAHMARYGQYLSNSNI
ncbi:MAG: CoA-binding protein [Deltaproteobacteria bacterium]|nr:CoA-binding protein [Deltaproteobacteria bacterium]